VSWVAQYEYLWADGLKVRKPVRLAAPDYINALFDWIEAQVPGPPAWIMPGPNSGCLALLCTCSSMRHLGRALPHGARPSSSMSALASWRVRPRPQCINAFPAWEAAGVPRQAPRQHV